MEFFNTNLFQPDSNSFTTISAAQKFAEHMVEKSSFGTEIKKDNVSLAWVKLNLSTVIFLAFVLCCI